MRAKLTIGPEGRISLPPAEAAALGVAPDGEVDLVAARGTFALVVPARAEGPGPFFAGTLAALTVAEVVQLVLSSLKTGVLLLASRREAARAPDDPGALRRRSLYFRDGQLVFASSSEPGERLGGVLLRHGLVPEGDLSRCSALVGRGRPLGQVLVDDGRLTSAQLYEAIGLQVKEIFLAAFLETSGEFAFLEGPCDEHGQVRLPDRTRDLVLEGMKRAEDAERRRARAEGERVVREAGDEIQIEVEVEVPAPTPPPLPASPPAPAAGGAPPRASGPFETYRRIFRRVHAALVAADPEAARRLDGYLERLPERRRAIFEGVRLGHDGDLDVARVLANVEASGAYRGAAARARSLEALEELLAFSLFEAKNRLPKAAAEALLREVGRMQVGKA